MSRPRRERWIRLRKLSAVGWVVEVMAPARPGAAAVRLRRRSPARQRADGVEIEVELEHVDTRLPEHAPLASLGVAPHQLPHHVLRHAALAGDPRHLELGGRRRQVGIEAGARRGDEVDRHRSGPLGVGRHRRGAHLLDHQLTAGRPQVGAAGGQGIVACPGGRGTRVEGPRTGERLPDEARSHDLAVPAQQAAAGLVGEEQLRQPGDRQRVGDSQQQRQHAGEENRGNEMSSQFHAASTSRENRRPQARPTAATNRSISLIPAKGTTMPPTP